MAPAVDGPAVGRGLVAALAVVVPAAVVGQLAEAGSPLRPISLLGVLVGLAVGGFLAGRAAVPPGADDEGAAGADRAGTRLPSGAAAGAAAYLVVQGVGVVLRLGRGESVAWLGLPLAALLSASVGMLGAWASGLRGGTSLGSPATGPGGPPGPAHDDLDEEADG